ncbi:MAG: DNA phosphorothioation-dependent restriction protein DptF [Opitutaceae bacterium]|nr:DNA phosphorothioation-dependent restriction protein DptF [Opitutaceae bacterium]
MKLREGLSALSKSSPYAVTTNLRANFPELDALKEYLFVETDIEREFRNKISNLAPRQILFLCGSSGDGKSEIMTRYNHQYSETIDFHLDATHSFHPKNTAIDTLDEVFSKHKKDGRPLVVGINIGMLGNYAEEGSWQHVDIRQTIKQFLNTKKADQTTCYYLDFESFPKFDLSTDVHTSDFLKQLLSKVTANTDENPIFRMYKQGVDNGDRMLSTNYQLLSIAQVQDVILELLLRARLEKDQFITARSLLDFIHILLTGPDYIFDNLFNNSDNELGMKITDFDPCAIRSKNLDMFILQRQLELPSEDFEQFSTDLLEFEISYDCKKVTKYSLVRLFYLIKDLKFSNNFHHKFRQEFNNSLIGNYAKFWNLNNNYEGGLTEKAELKDFYKNVVLTSINLYANRNATNLHKDEFFISAHGNWKLTAELELSADYGAIKKSEELKLGYFNAYIKVADKLLEPIPISINLLDLMYRIVRGYRPNKHDKNTVVLLDEIVDQIVEIANASNTLYLHADNLRIKLKQVDKDDIEVSGV